MKKFQDIHLEENVSLKQYNTFKIDSTTKYFATASSINGLRNFINYLKENDIAYFILGAGSNIILDDYFDGVVIKLSKLNNIKIEDNKVIVEAGAMLCNIASAALENSLVGLEWMMNIPGTLGGSVIGNAGAYNSEIFDDLISLKVLDNKGDIKTINKESIKHQYRHTNIKELGYIILEGTFLLTKGDTANSKKLIQDRMNRRLATQPLDMPTAGSVFKNPENDSAGRLIEASGLKGKTIGGAQVSLKHANFIVNTGAATSQDIKNLIKLIKEEVKKQFNVDLELEQEIIDWK